MKEQLKEKGVTPYNVLNNRVAKVALAASLLLTGVTTTISNVGPSNGIIGEWMEVDRAEAAGVVDGNFSYLMSVGGGATISDFNNSSTKNAIIPNYIGSGRYKVNTIGYSALANKELTSATIPNSVQIIEGYAFHQNDLKNLVIPSSVNHIGWGAFQLNQLTTIAIPDSVQSVGQYAFGTNQLTKVTIGSGVTQIAGNAFIGNPLLSSISVNSANSTYKSVNNGVYSKNGEKIVIGTPNSGVANGTKIIDVEAFSYVEMTGLEIPDSVTTIANGAFEGSKLTSITIPKSVTSIENDAFSDNFGLTEVYILNDNVALGANTFDGIPTSQMTIYGGKSSTAETFALANGYKFEVIDTSNKELGAEYFTYKDVEGGVSITGYTGAWKYFKIPDTLDDKPVVAIGDRAFQSKSLQSVTIPSSVTSIGASAFYGNNLTSVDIPDGITSIGDFAFSLNALTDVIIPSSVTSIGASAFRGNALTKIVIPDGITSIEDFAFYQNNLTSVDIPASVTSIGGSAFRSNALTSITIPAGVTSVGSSAFSSNAGLTKVYVLNDGTVFGSGIFAGPTASKITIFGGEYSSAQTYAFDNSHKFETIDNSDKELAEKHLTYKDVEGGVLITGYTGTLKFFKIPDTLDGKPVVAIGDKAFQNKSLQSVIIPSSVTSIGDATFYGNALESVDIPDGMTSIGANAFLGNKLTSVEIPDSVTSIGSAAFRGNALTKIVIPNGVTSIEDFVFYGNALTSVIIPSSVTSIGDYVFYKNNLTSVDIPSSVTSIGGSAFRSNALTSITIPAGVTSVGNSAFSSNAGLTKVYVLNDETVFGSGIFAGPTASKITIFGGKDSSAQTYALNNFHKFETLSKEDKELEAAILSVVQAELSRSQDDVDISHDLVNQLPEGEVKAGLLVRLDVIQKIIDDNKALTEQTAIATEAVVKAEGSQTQVNMDAARVLVNKLPENEIKRELSNRLDIVQQEIEDAQAGAVVLEKATRAVIKAETTKTQEDVNAARDLVNQLLNNQDKRDLTDRLDAIQQAIDEEKALQDAKDALDNLGNHPTQEELDVAKDKVDALPDSPEKDELLNQIKDKQEALDQANADKALAEQIAKATEAVVKAEGSQTQVDMDAARDLVSKLPDGEVKTDLTNRLDAIQQATDEDKALEEAKDAVDNLGDNPTQEELDKVKDKVDELSDGPAKDIILDQIKEKQDALDQANAIKSVEKAETSKTQGDVDTARNLVNKLSDGEVKTNLTNRLDVLQQVIDATKHLEDVRVLVNNLSNNPTQTQIDQARSAVESLPDSADKTEMSEIVEVKQNALDTKVADAREAVEAISTPPTLEEIASAQDKVNSLPKGDIKTDLQQAINEKKEQMGEIENQLVKAEEAVSKAENFPTNYNVTIATKLVESLPNGEEKTTLEERLQAIQDIFALEKAEAKVKQAENYERDPYLVDAIALVDALKDSAGKQALKERIQVILDKLQAIKDAEEAVKDANGAYDPADPNQSIQDAIDTIQDPAAKKYFTSWNKAVSNAENYFSKTTVKNSTKYLTDLPDAYTSVVSYENIIQELTERTENLKEEEVSVDVFAPVEKAVANYEKYKSNYYLKKAQQAVEALPNSPEKTAFEIRLGIGDGNGVPGNEPTEEDKLVAQLASVEKAVTTYEKYKTNFYQKKAIQAVEALTDSEAKTAFQARLDAVTK